MTTRISQFHNRKAKPMKTPATAQPYSSLSGRVLKLALHAAFLAALVVGSLASAATLEFDTNPIAGYQGGTSTWDDTTTSVWTTDGTALSTWNGGTGTDAAFASTLTSSASLTVNSAISVNSITIDKSTVTLTKGTGAITLGSGGLTIGSAGAATLGAGVLTGTGGLVVNTSTATSSSNSQSFTGQVQILKGFLTVNGPLANFGSDSGLGRGVVGTSVLIGTTNSSTTAGLLYIGGSATTNRTFTLASGGVGVIQGAAGNLGLTLNGVIDGGNSNATMIFSSQTTSDLVVAAQNTYLGSTRIYGSNTVQTITRIGVDNALTVGTTLNLGYTSGTYVGLFDLNGHNQELAGLVKTTGSTAATADISVFNRNATQATLTLNIASGTNTYNGTIGRSGGDNLALSKTGAGTLALLNANTYTGVTTVSAGTMLVSGTLANTSGVTISGGTLQLGAADRINNSATMTLSGGAFNVGGFSETLGTLTLTTATASSLDFGSGASILLFSGITADTGTLAITNWTSGSDSLQFTSGANLTASAFTVNGGAATILDHGTYFEIIPEPATWALLAFSLTTIMVLRRHRV